MIIKSISILTTEQLNKYIFYIPECNCSYWVNGDVKNNDLYPYQFVADPFNDSDELISHVSQTNGVRPVLIIEGLKRNKREKFTLFDIEWTVIDVIENDIVAVSKNIVEKTMFDPKISDWEKSFLKWFLEEWLEKMKEEYKDEAIKLTYEELQKKLEKYERRIKEGRLVDVSFVPGDKIWFIYQKSIVSGIVRNVQYDAEKHRVVVSGIAEDNDPFIIDKKNVYATKEEAEKVLCD